MLDRSALAMILVLLFTLLLGTTAVAQAPARGPDTLVIGIGELPTSLDPPTDWATPSTWIHLNIHDNLVWLNRETSAFEPWLAESYEQLDDYTWRFQLRQGVTFHNGEPFNADAVVWTYQRILDNPSMVCHREWLWIDEIRVLGPYEVEFVSKEPEPAFLSKMRSACGVIQAPGHGQAVGLSGVAESPVGTGPYRFVEYVKDEYLVMEANEDYWQGRPAIDRIVWRALPEASTRVASLLTGDIDLITGVPFQDWGRVNANDDTHVVEYLTTQVMGLTLRAGPSDQYPDWSGPTSDPNIRLAIQYAIDRELIIDVINDMGIPTVSRMTPPTMGWDERWYGQYGDYDPERARQLVEESGYDGEPLIFHASTTWVYQSEVAQVIASMLEAVGLVIDLRVLAPTTFREQVYFSYLNEEIYMHALGNSTFDPWVTVLSEQSDRRERTGWSGPVADEVDMLIRAGATDMNPESRRETYVRIQELLLEDPTHVQLYQMKETLGLNDRVDWSIAQDGFLWMGNAAIR